jgi:hypothetical protein
MQHSRYAVDNVGEHIKSATASTRLRAGNRATPVIAVTASLADHATGNKQPRAGKDP